MSRFWEIVFCLPLLFRRHVCLSKLKHSPSRELPLTARKTVFSHLNLKYLQVKITNLLWYFKIVSNFTRLRAREITFNNFEISLVVFMPNITTNHAITYTNLETGRKGSKSGASRFTRESWLTEDNYFIINHPNYELINCSFSCLRHPFVEFSVSERSGCTVDVVYFIDDILRGRFPQTVFDFTWVRRKSYSRI